MELHRKPVGFVAENCQLLTERMQALRVPEMQRSTGMIPIDDLVLELERRHPGFPDSVYRKAIGSIFFWYHLK